MSLIPCVRSHEPLFMQSVQGCVSKFSLFTFSMSCTLRNWILSCTSGIHSANVIAMTWDACLENSDITSIDIISRQWTTKTLTVHMCMLICTFVSRIWNKTGFLMMWLICISAPKQFVLFKTYCFWTCFVSSGGMYYRFVNMPWNMCAYSLIIHTFLVENMYRSITKK